MNFKRGAVYRRLVLTAGGKIDLAALSPCLSVRVYLCSFLRLLVYRDILGCVFSCHMLETKKFGEGSLFGQTAGCQDLKVTLSRQLSLSAQSASISLDVIEA